MRRPTLQHTTFRMEGRSPHRPFSLRGVLASAVVVKCSGACPGDLYLVPVGPALLSAAGLAKVARAVSQSENHTSPIK